MGMEAADPMRTPRAQNASFNHAPRYAVIAGQLFRVPLVARPLLSISAFRAEFGLGVIWLSEVRFAAGGRRAVGSRRMARRLRSNARHSPVGRSVLQIGHNLLMPIGQSLHSFAAIPLGSLKNPQL